MKSSEQVANRDNTSAPKSPSTNHQNSELNSFELKTRNLVENIVEFVLTEHPETIEMLEFYDSLTPIRLTNNDIFREISWVVYNSGFRFDVIKKYWPILKEAYCHFEVTEVAKWSNDLDFHAKRICKVSGFNNLRKAKWCISNAQRILELENEKSCLGGLVGYFDALSKKSAEEIVKTIPVIIQELGFVGIGNVTIFHLLKNVGIEIFKPDIHVRRILAELGLIDLEDTNALEICNAINFLGSVVNMGISELDTLLFVYGRVANDQLQQALKTIPLPENIEC